MHNMLARVDHGSSITKVVNSTIFFLVTQSGAFVKLYVY